MTLLAADEVRRFGLKPRVALLSHSNFGSSNAASAQKMRAARHLILDSAPDMEVEGEMQADVAVSPEIRQRIFPNSVLKEQANLLVMPDLDAANIAFNLMKQLADGLPVGPILAGAARSVHILTPSVTSRGILNMSAVAAVGAQHLSASTPRML
jgi:malate dehydrogenase (oxaloacetate-decarboxylating)(NADP+)